MFEGLAAEDFAELPRDEEWLFGMSLLAPVCAFLGDTGRAALLYDLLWPYAERNALSVPDLSTGSVAPRSASSRRLWSGGTRPPRISKPRWL